MDAHILCQAALRFFTLDEISEGRLLLVSEFEVFLHGVIGQFKVKRRTTQEGQAHEAEFDDILELFNIIVSKGLTKRCLFVVSDFARLSALIFNDSGPDGVNTRQIASVKAICRETVCVN